MKLTDRYSDKNYNSFLHYDSEMHKIILLNSTPPKIVTCIFYVKCFISDVEYNSNIIMASAASVKNHSQRDLPYVKTYRPTHSEYTNM